MQPADNQQSNNWITYQSNAKAQKSTPFTLPPKRSFSIPEALKTLTSLSNKLNELVLDAHRIWEKIGGLTELPWEGDCEIIFEDFEPSSADSVSSGHFQHYMSIQKTQDSLKHEITLLVSLENSAINALEDVEACVRAQLESTSGSTTAQITLPDVSQLTNSFYSEEYNIHQMSQEDLIRNLPQILQTNERQACIQRAVRLTQRICEEVKSSKKLSGLLYARWNTIEQIYDQHVKVVAKINQTK